MRVYYKNCTLIVHARHSRSPKGRLCEVIPGAAGPSGSRGRRGREAAGPCPLGATFELSKTKYFVMLNYKRTMIF